MPFGRESTKTLRQENEIKSFRVIWGQSKIIEY